MNAHSSDVSNNATSDSPQAPARQSEDVEPPTAASAYLDGQRSRRRSIVAATVVTLFMTAMFFTGAWWAVTGSVAALVAADYWDRQLRPDPSDLPVVAYILGIYLAGAVVIAIAATILFTLLIILP